MNLDKTTQTMLPAVEEALHAAIDRFTAPQTPELRYMLAYHLGWEGEGSGPEAQGKRIRPLLLLLACETAGGDWHKALPAAAAVELLHNFSLIHDDIQDNSPLRRGRDTVWVKWGVAQAINAGDLMFTIAHQSMLALQPAYPAEIVLQAARILHDTCVELTRGQYLDLAFESRPDVSLDDYWSMIAGKTAALLGACARIGALLGGAGDAGQQAFQAFGANLGLAFQVQDDLLGIWGDASQTGKSTESDLAAGKKSLPVVFGLRASGPFAQRWRAGKVLPADAPALAAQLASEGAYDYTKENTGRLTNLALEALSSLPYANPARDALAELANRLLGRQA